MKRYTLLVVVAILLLLSSAVIYAAPYRELCAGAECGGFWYNAGMFWHALLSWTY